MRGLMKTAKGFGHVEVRELDKPTLPADDWVLIKIKAAGICATDIHILRDEFPRYWPPVVLGHEFSGEVEQVGAKVTRYRVGDRVVAEPKNQACGVCDVCREGKTQLCIHRRAPGWGVHGAMTDYIAMPEFLLHKIPDGVPYDIAALCEPLAVAVHEVTERAGVECSDIVVVTGAGPIGILAAFVAKACGASKVIMTGMSKSEAVRFPIALSMGVDVVVNVEKEDPVKRVMELTGGKGADLLIETSGAGPAIMQLVEMAKPCGRISAIGLCAKDMASLKWNSARFKALDLHFNFSSSYSSWEKALRLMASTTFDLSNVITHRAQIDDWERVFQDIQDEKGVKGMFLPEGQ